MMTYSRVGIVFILSLVACVALVVSGGFSQSSTNPIVTTNTLHTQAVSGGGQTHATQGASVANTLAAPSGTMPASHEQPAVMCPLITAIKIGNRPAPPCPPLPIVPLSPCSSDEVAVNVLVMLPMRKCISERIGSYVFTSLTPRFAVHAPVCALCTKITAPGTRISCIFAYSWVSKI